jgi:hypothetical protein
VDWRNTDDIELVRFGLMPEFIGQGLGRYFLQWAIDKAWGYRPRRFWLHTCTLDHPAALPNYLKAGVRGLQRRDDEERAFRLKALLRDEPARGLPHESTLYCQSTAERHLARPPFEFVARHGGGIRRLSRRGAHEDAQRVAVPDRVVPVQRRIGGYRRASSARGGRQAMNDDTRKLLKVFGVAVTDAEAEAERLAGTAAQLSASASKEEVAKLLKDASDLCRELNTRWLEITQRVFAIQSRLQQQLAEAGARLQAEK